MTTGWRKSRTRHTHIFGEDKARSSEEALKNWEKNKLREKSITSVAQNLKEVPKGMPSLLRAYKVVKRAAKGGLISSERNSAFEEALKKLRETADVCFEGKDAENLAGETLFNLVNLLRLADIEPEAALNKFTEKFVEKAVQAEVRTRTEND